MREWNLKSNDPITLTIAADARLGPTDYCNDQIWGISIGSGDPSAIALHTTFGLRAKIFRLFPRFSEADRSFSSPSEFYQQPLIKNIFPNYLRIIYSPFIGIDVESEYWVPESHGVVGYISINNNSQEIRRINFEWIAQLNPINGTRMAAFEIESTTILAGRTDDIYPSVFLTGGSKVGSGPYPSLCLDIELEPNTSKQIIWSHAALNNLEDSFRLARDLANRSWKAILSRIRMTNAGQVEIFTGNLNWDSALMLSQQIALELVQSYSEQMPYPTFVSSRQPNHGFSIKGDGSDYDHFWDGQSPLETWYIINIILPNAPDLAKGFILNFFANQKEDGLIDFKPGLAGQRSHLLATPILAHMTWRIYEFTRDKDFLRNCFEGLCKYINNWFLFDNDRDHDQIPEWNHPIQTGLDDHPIYSFWQLEAIGINIQTSESSALCSLLYQEIQSLIQIACELDLRDLVDDLSEKINVLTETVRASWRPEIAIFQDRDRDTHLSTKIRLMGKLKGSGLFLNNDPLENPSRILLHIKTESTTMHRLKLFIHGRRIKGNSCVDQVRYDQFKWHLGYGKFTSEKVYQAIDHIEILGLNPKDETTVFIPGYDHQDISMLFPIWANIPDKDQAQLLIQNTITDPDRFWLPYGIPNYIGSVHSLVHTDQMIMNLILNAIIGEGLINYGYRNEAVQLITGNMNAILNSLKIDNAFRQYYSAETGQGIGERNVISGLAPVNFFLNALGVKLISPKKIIIEDKNLFPWPVTVKYRGMTILRQTDKTLVTFPDGRIVSIDETKPCIISSEFEDGFPNS